LTLRESSFTKEGIVVTYSQPALERTYKSEVADHKAHKLAFVMSNHGEFVIETVAAKREDPDDEDADESGR
jgi:hypothetical protein